MNNIQVLHVLLHLPRSVCSSQSYVPLLLHRPQVHWSHCGTQVEETDLYRSLHWYRLPLHGSRHSCHCSGCRLPGQSSWWSVQGGVQKLGCVHHDHNLLHLLLCPLLSHLQLPLLPVHPGFSPPERRLRSWWAHPEMETSPDSLSSQYFLHYHRLSSQLQRALTSSLQMLPGDISYWR